MYDKIKHLSKENKKFFKRACIAHVIDRVERVVYKHSSDEALECVKLVRLWLRDENSVSAAELNAAVNTAKTAARYAKGAPWGDAALAASYAASSAVGVLFPRDPENASQMLIQGAAVQDAKDAAEAAAWSNVDDWDDIIENEEQWQENLIDNMLRKQSRGDENEEQWQKKLIGNISRKQGVDIESDDEELITFTRDLVQKNQDKKAVDVIAKAAKQQKLKGADRSEIKMAVDYIKQHLREQKLKQIIKSTIKEQIKRI